MPGHSVALAAADGWASTLTAGGKKFAYRGFLSSSDGATAVHISSVFQKRGEKRFEGLILLRLTDEWREGEEEKREGESSFCSFSAPA